MDKIDPKDRPVYMISIAAKLAKMHPQTLRIYERKRLLKPGRTPKSTRLYSERDIERLRHIQQLTREFGINLAGVRMIMELHEELEEIQETVRQMEEHIKEKEQELVNEVEKVRQQFRRELVWIPRREIEKLS